MPQEDYSAEQAMRYMQDTLYVTGGKWKLLILTAIHAGSKRFKEIQGSVPGITAKVLSKELKDLELNKLITRTVYDTTPVTIEYEGTEYCQSLNTMINEMIKWGAMHRKQIRD